MRETSTNLDLECLRRLRDLQLATQQVTLKCAQLHIDILLTFWMQYVSKYFDTDTGTRVGNAIGESEAYFS